MTGGGRRSLECGPPFPGRLPGGIQGWLVTRYDDVVRLFTHPDVRCNPRYAGAVLERALGAAGRERPSLRTSLLTSDPPEHPRLRAHLDGAFGPRQVEAMRPRIQQAADSLIDAFAGAGRADLVRDYAAPLALTIVREAVGLPELDGVRLQAWLGQTLRPLTGPEAIRRMEETLAEAGAHVRAAMANRRADLPAGLAAALLRHRDAGDITGAELLDLLLTVLFAGMEAPAAAVSSAMLTLLRRPDLLAEARQDEARLPIAVDELIRHGGPITGVNRYTAAPVRLGGVEIPAGCALMLCVDIANRDPARFPAAETIDLRRTDNPHLGFGRGIHYCPGGPLGRVTAVVAVGSLLRRLPDLRLADPAREPAHRDTTFVRSLAELPVRFAT
jgi:cytochrome P450